MIHNEKSSIKYYNIDKNGNHEIVLNGYELYCLYINEINKILRDNNDNVENHEIILSYPPYLKQNHLENIKKLFDLFKDECIYKYKYNVI